MRKDAIADLKRSGISIEDAEYAGFFSIDDASELFEEMQPAPALVLPYFDPWTGEMMEFERDGEAWEFARVRYLDPPRQKRGFKKAKAIRYGQPQDSGVFPFFPRCEHFDWVDVAEDTNQAIVITEGEKKALAGCLAGVATLGLGGVYNFLSDGELIEALDGINWKRRPVYICYDSDAADNPDIQAAEGRLATELSLKRRATVYLCRLPGAKNGAKQGIDDLIVNAGEDAFTDALENSVRIRKTDSAVLSLNAHVAWIESEGKIYDFGSRLFLQKENFVRGSKYSALTVEVPAKKGGGVKVVRAAEEWLTHPHAQRYPDIVFDPASTARTVTTESGLTALNTWKGLESSPGDVTPFLKLTKHLCKDLDPSLHDFLIKLMAYKLQNPAEKIAIAIVFTGGTGTGKSMWARWMRKAVGAYGRDVKSEALASDFNGFIENSLIAVIDEAKGVQLRNAVGTLRNLISEESAWLNEKYRVARQVRTYTMYILTSNEQSVASYSHDDRRMFVVDVQDRRPQSEYIEWVEWERAGGPAHIAHFLLEYDLKGWTPPAHAPMTPEKYLAYREGLTPIQRIAEDMQTADEHTIIQWIDAAMAWADEQELSNNAAHARLAQEVRVALGAMPIRPFYTPEELAAIFPHLTATLHGQRNMVNTPAGEISRQLREAGGAKYLRPKDDPRGFRYRGMLRQYLVIAEHEDWRAPMTQNEFDRLMKEFPRYAQLKR